ncbi:MAG: hypothetical protein ACJAUQ_001533 [Maribacter sp.]|jgi:hypothetical protein
MKKHKFINRLLLVGMVGILFAACAEGDLIFDEIISVEKRGSTLRTIEVTQSEVEYDIPSESLIGGGFSATVEVQDQENGNLLQSLDVYIGYNDKTSDKGDSSVGDTEVLVESFSLADGTIGPVDLPRFTYAATAAELQSAVGILGDQIFGGDAFTIRFEIVRTDGEVYSAADNSGTITGSYFSSPFEYEASLVCGPKPTQAGTWTVDMQDAYGDGWQSTTGDGGGPAIIVTLSDGTVYEIGLCTPYEDSEFDCTAGDAEGTATFEVPPGQTANALIDFQGDFWGEISFQIFSPAGSLVADIGTGTAAGPIAIDYCAD